MGRVEQPVPAPHSRIPPLVALLEPAEVEAAAGTTLGQPLLVEGDGGSTQATRDHSDDDTLILVLDEEAVPSTPSRPLIPREQISWVPSPDGEAEVPEDDQVRWAMGRTP
jgi:hypothetical protein